MKVRPTRLRDVLEIEPRVFRDPRGSFFESWNRRTFAEYGLDPTFVQDNQSTSVRNTLRGLHYQNPNPQGKLVRVVSGRVFDVAVDLRHGSPTFGEWVGVELQGDDPSMLWIPPGFAHGFYTLSERAELLYKCTDYYSPRDEHTLIWNDPDLAIAWPLGAGRQPLLSAKDAAGSSLREAEIYR